MWLIGLTLADNINVWRDLKSSQNFVFVIKSLFSIQMQCH